ncbi:MAG: regulatory protein RecX [Thiogranum sp.]|nr:regulatory protein RecX [Thiogranum sp.]
MSRSSLRPPPEAVDAGEAYQKSHATALRLLARREHSVLELRDKLAARSFTDDIVEPLLAELTGSGLLSDRRFAEAYVRGRVERGYGPQRIQAELRERGIRGSLADEMLEAWSGTWLESAREQRGKRFGTGFPEDFAARARQMRFLQQRGFTGEQIRAVFNA